METMNDCTPKLSPRSGRGHLAHGEAPLGKGAESESTSPDGAASGMSSAKDAVPDCTDTPVKGMPDFAPTGLGGIPHCFFPRFRRGLNDVTRFAGFGDADPSSWLRRGLNDHARFAGSRNSPRPLAWTGLRRPVGAPAGPHSVSWVSRSSCFLPARRCAPRATPRRP